MKLISKMKKNELRDACIHQRVALQTLLASHMPLKPVFDDSQKGDLLVLSAAEESAQRALDAYE